MRIFALGTVVAMTLFAPAFAYDGTNCRAPGNCWEPKPDYPEQVAGSQYDPQHDPAEISKQQASLEQMDNRNAWRIWHRAQTGEFVYDVADIPGYEEGGTPPAQ